ncbi:sigma-54 dependent transcriptional regulator [Uliginosibacterium sp. H3]|uniref:Sigma-54 dependent transcriptional regulator n=1 Tax=Uliginosibacterium silvisoli TaxID=3114758 RepID=A0ABU6K7A8_9RHOO|nr:sigma-54 dependent transcriptional regulator [Uliginosibacterium sp. H3]
MPSNYRPGKLLSFPDPSPHALSIRAKALVFSDPRSMELLEQIDLLGPSDVSVLIQGESGTGKELVARHLHEQSGRTGPFVAVNCGAFSETLIEAELFGHEAGAFTGAQGARAGWFEAANGGTLFLDEIGDLPLAMQVKLLRVLQEREVVRLGSRKPVALDVRLVAATNVDLARAVASGHFRVDLFYRVNVAALVLPPLRERQGDIEPLACYFAGLYAQRIGVAEPKLALETVDALRHYTWPGNIRELENVIHFALLVSRGNVVRPDDLRFAGVAAPGASAESNLTPQQGLERALTRYLASQPEQAFEQIESALVHLAFRRNNSNQVRSAQALGVTRNVMRTLLKRHGLLEDGNIEDESGADRLLATTSGA